MNIRIACGVLTLAGTMAAAGIGAATAEAVRPLVTAAIDDRQTVELIGDTRPEANARNDRGAVDDSLPLAHMQLLMKRPAEVEAALNTFIDQLHDRSSANFHHWLTADQLAAQFGPAEADVQAVTSWLARHGMIVNSVHPNRMIIDFSGTAGQVRETFQTEIHQLDARGVMHFANMSNPHLPAALADAVHGVVSLHDFRPHTLFKPRPQFTFTDDGETTQAVTPGDLATIYNLTTLFNAGFSGQGQTIVLIEDSDVFSTADWSTFRSTFGLSSFTEASFMQEHPAPSSGSNNCTDPGVVSGNEAEAELDVEYSSASAPSAAIVLASCADSSTTFGGLIALENLLSESSPPAIVSISFGECEAANGATANATYSSTYQTAVAAGVSVFVGAGDSGAAGCDEDAEQATHGIAVSGFASTAFNVAVGGTDFGDTFAGTNSDFWNTTNSSSFESAKSYINEIPWNVSCASGLIASFEGFSTSSGRNGFCNTSTGEEFLTTAAGGGGPSGCFSGSASTSEVVSGSCAGNPKPSWQSVLGNPSDGVRDTPDVSLFAANAPWGHTYVYCDSDTSDGGATCAGESPTTWSEAGGTSFSTPIMAGIMALVDQKTGERQGNPNPTLYSLASTEYGSSGSSACNSSNGASVGSSCIFYDVTQGDNDVNCTGSNGCFKPSGRNGVLSSSTSTSEPSFKTTTGWDFATGIGTIDAANLVNNF